MLLQDLSFDTPEENIHYDEMLLKNADDGRHGDVLRFWESRQVFIVLGRTGKAEEEILQDAAARDGIPVLQRSSGGGTVVQGPGCLNYALVLSKDRDPRLRDIRRSYEAVFEKIIGALHESGVPAVFRPVSDLAVKGTERKFSGNAQRRGRTHMLQHGTILYDFDLTLIEKYLKMPPHMPEYRAGRRHAEFVTNVTVDTARFKACLSGKFGIKESEAI